MTANERWREVKALLDQALDQPPEQRRAFLEEACDGDDLLRRQASIFLAEEHGIGDFLAEPIFSLAPEGSVELEQTQRRSEGIQGEEGRVTAVVDKSITELLLAWRGGEEQALVRLMPMVYEQLKQIAGRLLRHERQGRDLQTTALVHEAYLRLLELKRISWKDRAHFFAMCARIMRRVLIDHARKLDSVKRGGRAVTLSLQDLQDEPQTLAPTLLGLDEAIRQLKAKDPERARIVELRFFGGLGRKEVAEVLGLSPATVTRRWRSARAWLLRYMGPD